MGRAKSAESHRIFAEKLAAGESVKDSMLAAGYSLSTSLRGLAGVSKPMAAAAAKAGHSFIKLSRAMSNKDKEDLIMGRLAHNVIVGKDAGALSCKTMGSHKDLALWQTETQVGVIVVNSPKDASKSILDE